VIAAVVTFAVIFGLPSRSPPIQVPKLSGLEVGETVTPRRLSSVAKSSRTSGIVNRKRSSK